MGLLDKDGKPVEATAEGGAEAVQAEEFGTGWWVEPHGIAGQPGGIEWMVWRVRRDNVALYVGCHAGAKLVAEAFAKAEELTLIESVQISEAIEKKKKLDSVIAPPGGPN